MLPENMEQLKDSVDECKKLATATEAKFDLWLNIASELSQVAAQSQGTLETPTMRLDEAKLIRTGDTHNTLYDTRTEFETTKIVEDAAMEAKTRQEAAVKEAQRQMEHAEKQLESATQRIPSGMQTNNPINII